MFRKIFGSFLILTFILTVQAASVGSVDGTRKHILDISHWRTPNGAEVYFIPIHELPMIDIKIAFDAGSARDGTQFGLANFTVQMLSEGTKRFSAEQVAEAFDNYGAVFSNSADQDMAVLGLRSLTNPAYLDPVIDTFTSVVSEPAFNAKDFSRIQKQILTQIDDQDQTPSALADNAFYKSVFGNYPYGHELLGKKADVEKTEVPDLQKFYNTYYSAENAVIAIVGDVTREQAEKLANKIVGQLPHGEAAPKLTAPTYDPEKLTSHVTYPASQTYIRIGELSIKRDDPRYFPLVVGNYILGGGLLTSRLFDEVREKRGLSYNIRSSVTPMKNAGTFMVTLQTRNETAEEAITLSKKVVSDFITNGVTEKELTEAKQNIIGSFFSSLDSNSAIVNNLTFLAFYQLPINYFDVYRDKIAAVEKQQIENAFNEILNPKRMVTVTVGPEKIAIASPESANKAMQVSDNAMVRINF